MGQYQMITQNRTHVYHQSRHMDSIWKYKWLPVIFSLVVDDFGVKYIEKKHVDHIINSIRKY